MEETHQSDERDNDSRGERDNPRLHTRVGIVPGNKKGRESTQQRTRINAHANMEIHHNSTHESIDRRNTAEKHKHRHNINMEANRNNEQTDHKNTHAIQHTRKSENKKRSEARSSRRRILTLQYEYE